jgi:predicted N-acetyltransferase YhbS
VAIERLTDRHDLGAFESGVHELDDYLRRHALENQSAHFGVTHVAVSMSEIAGFVTVSPSQIECADVTLASARRLPRYPLPTLTLARLAVDRRWQGMGVGTMLLRFALREALRMAEEFGCIGVRVKAKPDAVDFYARFGFIGLRLDLGGAEGAQHLFLALNQIEDATQGG